MARQREFRFVIVGAGSAGCLLARLLAERQSDPVAVIEAGGSSAASDVRSVVPNFYPRTFGSTLDWNFTTLPQAGLAQRRIPWPRGKAVGGSGAINALIYMQAAAADFEHWGSFHNLHPRALSHTADYSLADQAGSDCASADHRLAIAPLESHHPWTAGFLQAAQAAGLQRFEHWTRSVANSCGYFHLTHRQGRRSHTGQLLHADRNPPPNLELFSQATVQRLVLRGQRASGIEMLDAQGELATVHASEEVILCAGAVGSPTLLLASGIGPPDKLLREHIKCLHELPAVGENLQDHLVYPLIYACHTAGGLPRRHPPADRKLYRQQGTGPLASNIAEAGALFQLNHVFQATHNNSEPQKLPRPEFQLHFTPTHYLKYPRLESGNRFLSVAITDLHPRSRGQISLVRQSSSNYQSNSHQSGWQICIDPRYLHEPVDAERMLQAIAWTREMCRHSGLNELIEREVLPGAKRSQQTELLRSLQTFAQSIYHPVGTCRMDSPSAAGSSETVVDRDFRVHGLTGLRIVDASVLPSLPSCNTNAVTLWLAGQAANRLLGC